MSTGVNVNVTSCRLRKRVRFGLPQTPLSRMITPRNDTLIHRTEGFETTPSRDSFAEVTDEEENERRPLLNSQRTRSASQLTEYYFSINTV